MNTSGKPVGRGWAEKIWANDQSFWRGANAFAFTDKQRGRVSLLIRQEWRECITNWMNLCPPHPVCGYWKARDAKFAAEMFVQCLQLRFKCVEEPLLIVCCGTRVARALRDWMNDYPERLGSVTQGSTFSTNAVRFTRVPHPSDRNRQWQNPDTIRRCKEHLEVEMLKHFYPAAIDT